MIVVADTSPLNYLIQIGCDNLLPQLYRNIMIPNGVFEELRHAGAPASVHAWLSHLPDWVEVVRVTSAPLAELSLLGIGEREAIQLSEELNADLLLIDEHKGRQEAKRRGLRTTGTLGVLVSAADYKLIDVHAAYQRLLTETSFRTSAALETRFLEQIRSKS
jgi:predicted nucleic acid-binding protein